MTLTRNADTTGLSASPSTPSAADIARTAVEFGVNLAVAKARLSI
jgi:hypothetical protein